MKLARFRIQHYKPIVDSSDCYLGSDMTILAGKNESGKTAILEALRDFDDQDSTSFPDDALPINSSTTPCVELW